MVVLNVCEFLRVLIVYLMNIFVWQLSGLVINMGLCGRYVCMVLCVYMVGVYVVGTFVCLCVCGMCMLNVCVECVC